jgi:hypothetical protein
LTRCARSRGKFGWVTYVFVRMCHSAAHNLCCVLFLLLSSIREIFAAFESEYTVFCPMEHCWELFGLDFMMDITEDGKPRVYILEVNPGPDFKQTGDRLKLVIEELLFQTCQLIVPNKSSMSSASPNDELGRLVPVYDKEWSVSKLGIGMEMK